MTEQPKVAEECVVPQFQDTPLNLNITSTNSLFVDREEESQARHYSERSC